MPLPVGNCGVVVLPDAEPQADMASAQSAAITTAIAPRRLNFSSNVNPLLVLCLDS
jgi:hypothetical protein